MKAKEKNKIILEGLLAGLNYADTYGRDGNENELTIQATSAIKKIKEALKLICK